MSETQQNTNDKQEHFFDPQEEKALDIFLKSLDKTISAAHMYFLDHPSLHLAVEGLKDKLLELSLYYKEEIEVYFAGDILRIKGTDFKPENARCRNLAGQFHKRKISALRLKITAGSQELKEFVYVFAHIEDHLNTGQTIKEIFSSIPGVEIEELDYSSLLALSGGCSADIWDVLFKRSGHVNIKSEQIQMIAGNADSIFSQLISFEDKNDMAPEILENLNRIGDHFKEVSLDKKKKFAESVAAFVLSLDKKNQERFLSQERFSVLKDVIKGNVEKKSLLKQIIDDVSSSGTLNPLMLNMYNELLQGHKTEEELSADVSAYVEGESEENRKRLHNIFKELFLQDDSDQFVSVLYHNTLSSFDNTDILSGSDKEGFGKYFTREQIEHDYFYSLLEMFYASDNVEMITKIIEKLGSIVSGQQGRLKLEHLHDLNDAIEKKKAQKNAEGINIALGLYEDKIGVRQCYDSLIDEYIMASDSARVAEIEDFLLSMDPAELILLLLPRETRCSGSINQTRRIVSLLGRIEIDQAVVLLEKMFKRHLREPFFLVDIAEQLVGRKNVDTSLFEPFLFSRDYKLRMYSAQICCSVSDENYRNTVIGRLLRINNLFGLKNQFLIENIEIAGQLRAVPALPYLEKTIVSPGFVFGQKRDRLRIAAIKAVAEIDKKALFDLKHRLKNESSRAVLSAFKVLE